MDTSHTHYKVLKAPAFDPSLLDQKLPRAKASDGSPIIGVTGALMLTTATGGGLYFWEDEIEPVIS